MVPWASLQEVQEVVDEAEDEDGSLESDCSHFTRVRYQRL